MHAAEDDVFASRACGFLRKLVGVSAEIGEANHLVALIVVTKNHALATQSLAGGCDAFVHGIVGQDEVVFQTANCCCGSHCHVSPSAPDANAIAALPQKANAGSGTGMLKDSSGSSRFTTRRLKLRRAQPAGMLKPLTLHNS